MNKIAVFFISKVLPLLFMALPISGQAEQRYIPARDMQVEDGDTLIVSIESKTFKIQLGGIDAPEDTDNPKLKVDLSRTRIEKEKLLAIGRLATEHLRSLINENTLFKLHFDPAKKDRYGRTPGNIMNSDGLSLSELMVKNGFAIFNTRSTSDDLRKRLEHLQREALAKGKGLWGHNPSISRAWAGIKSSL